MVLKVWSAGLGRNADSHTLPQIDHSSAVLGRVVIGNAPLQQTIPREGSALLVLSALIFSPQAKDDFLPKVILPWYPM